MSLRRPWLVALPALGLMWSFGCDLGGTPGSSAPEAEQVAPPDFRKVAIDGPARNLSDLLVEHAKAATARGGVPFLLMTTPSCEHCRELLSSLDDSRMQEALQGVDALHLSVDGTQGWLDDPVLIAEEPHRVPSLFAMSASGSLTARLTGDAWGTEDKIEVMAPVLADFVRRHGVALPAPDPDRLPEALRPVELAPGMILRKLPGGLPKDAEVVPVDGGPPVYRREAGGD